MPSKDFYGASTSPLMLQSHFCNRKRDQLHYSNTFCSTQEGKSHGFGKTWGRANKLSF